ncbi:hypothetical protein [Nitrosomonas ureae]|uniref:ParB-like nuclease domain-containing protein n=1 Tax=Nitrosomonas ureae TaxID=44577 RepID=A0A286AMC1_9PROT|nr:hypothetical protein [Nitrosomonas ureae]SOD23024.1 hypothetical protein SAMN06297164_3655 [Nitrosomonas ureae]
MSVSEYCRTVLGSHVHGKSEVLRLQQERPAVTTFFNGAEHILVDGFHRYWAHKNLGILDIESDIYEGPKREAILFSASVNGTHGLRLTNQDKRKHVLVLLNDEEWKYWTDSAIAKHCKVTQPFVGKIRKEIITVIISPPKPASNLESGKKLSAGTSSETEQSDQKEHKDESDDRDQKLLESADAIQSLAGRLQPILV